jgi:AcrR family transcriptional regulator
MRADARLNRERVVAAAAAVLAEGGDLAFEVVAARAGVGVGTVYRRFESRHELVEAVYEHELDEVCAAAVPLLDRLAPEEALRAWLDRYAEFVATKRGMGEALRELISSGAVTSTSTRTRLAEAVAPVLAAGVASGELRDVPADDVVAAMAGALMASGQRADQLARLLDLLVAGVRR